MRVTSNDGALHSYSYFTVVGVGRSGTSLLMTMLDSHPQIALPPETQFIFRHVAPHPRATIDQLRRRIDGENNFSRLDFDLNDFFHPFTSGKRPFSMDAAYRRIMEMWATRTGCRIIGDKSPKNVEYLPIVKAIYPDARVIHIVRDPRDVFLSRTKAQWCAHRHQLAQTLAYRAQYDLARRQGPATFGDNYLEVSYEQLIQNPESELTKVCRLLGVEYTTDMLERSASASTHVFAEEMNWKREVLGPLLADNSEKWRTELPPAQLTYIEDCCRTSFDDGRYRSAKQTTYRPAGIARKLRRTAMDVLSACYGHWMQLRNRTVVRSLEGTAIFAMSGGEVATKQRMPPGRAA